MLPSENGLGKRKPPYQELRKPCRVRPGQSGYRLLSGGRRNLGPQDIPHKLVVNAEVIVDQAGMCPGGRARTFLEGHVGEVGQSRPARTNILAEVMEVWQTSKRGVTATWTETMTSPFSTSTSSFVEAIAW
jgi:hypothetical protein